MLRRDRLQQSLTWRMRQASMRPQAEAVLFSSLMLVKLVSNTLGGGLTVLEKLSPQSLNPNLESDLFLLFGGVEGCHYITLLDSSSAFEAATAPHLLMLEHISENLLPASTPLIQDQPPEHKESLRRCLQLNEMALTSF